LPGNLLYSALRWEASAMRPLPAAVLCSSIVLIAGCGTASSPRDAAGVRAMYRSIGLDASAGAFTDVCRSYMDAPLRAQVERANDDCTASSSTSKLERWAEKVRLSKIESGTRIVVSGDEALVYDAAEPERALYGAGQWRLAEAPELATAAR
jgi:hypothetical protein